MDIWIVASAFFAYCVAVLAIGIVAERFNKNISDYYLADRTLGPWVSSISSTASSESGWVTLGAVGMAYSMGLSAIWFVPGCLLGYVLNWYFLVEKIRKSSREKNSLTVADHLEAILNDKTRILRIVAVLIIFFFLGSYVSAQFVACGKLFQSAFGIPYKQGILIGVIITIFYTLVGGFRAVCWTDLLQGLLMVFGLVVLPIVAISSVGGLDAVLDGLAQESAVERFEITDQGGRAIVTAQDGTTLSFNGDSVKIAQTADGYKIDSIPSNVSFMDNPPRGEILSQGDSLVEGKTKAVYRTKNDLLSLFGNLPMPFALGMILGLLGIGLGYPGQPHIIARYMSIRGQDEVRRGRVIAITWGVLVYYGAIFSGLSARVLLPKLADPEHAYIQLVFLLLPPILCGVLLSAVFAAICSTADSQLLVCASALSRDIYQQLLGRPATEQKLLRISQFAVFIIGVSAALFALADVRVIFWFVLFAWSGLGASFGPVIILSLYWKRLNRWGALAGMLVGCGTTIYWKIALSHIIYELIPAFFLSLVAAVIVSLITGRETKK